ncbi:DUF2235 domain-containing protein [Sneathiella glossodoripedis]|uniref:DUF2235 domain-containing protein n=1 Tax=Sneathiella glossodoripedis TaxID=418853 RepID=UPI0004709CDB|nr:DUF2235 domain-containing protein [Sneathiella glossodoripedis]
MKRIVIFSDGTWNSPEQGGSTNVLMLARGVKPIAGDGHEQVAFYDWGVGTDRKKLMGGVTGEGIDKNIQDCYRFLVHNYNPGDRLFLFGFSRGAYTVRSLTGFIRNCGLLKRQFSEKIPEAYALYRKRTKDSHPDEARAKNFRQQYAVADKIPVEFVGAWDTVGALGVPVPFWGTLGKKEFLFHDTSPSGIIKHLRHAISIDEDREDFQVTPFKLKSGSTVDLKEVWFPGVHSDVGGSYDVHGLSDAACKWMMDEAQGFGLEFEPHVQTWLSPDFASKMHEERKGIYRVRDKVARKITGAVHRSAKERWDADISGYKKRSAALNELLAAHGNNWDAIEIAH